MVLKRFTSKHLQAYIKEQCTRNRKGVEYFRMQREQPQAANVKGSQLWQHNHKPIEGGTVMQVIDQKLIRFNSNPVVRDLLLSSSLEI